jgi:murein DD-endopeptidase MepM/ murein hydrolase activator NlpD
MKTTAAFALGFAAGVVCLAGVLWITGNLMGNLTGNLTSVHALAAPKIPEAIRLDAGDRAQPPKLPPPLQLPDTPPDPSGTPAPPLPAVVAAGASLGMPIAGVDPRTLHSNFSEARGGHAHEALDIMAPRGTEVLAVAEGNVVKLFTSKPGGLTVYQFDDSRTWCYYYAHLDRYAPGLKEGMLLRKGDVLGYVGSTGDASPNAPHLHFAVFQLGPEKHWWQGTAVDPLPLLK